MYEMADLFTGMRFVYLRKPLDGPAYVSITSTRSNNPIEGVEQTRNDWTY
jgi:hypothetical protein